MKKILLTFIAFLLLFMAFPQNADVQAAGKGEEGGFCRETEPKCDTGLTCKYLPDPFNGNFCMTSEQIDSLGQDVTGVNLTQIQKSIDSASIPGSINEVISKMIPYIFTIAGLLLLIFFIVSGFQFIFASGDPKKMEVAKAHITTALIGFIIVFVAYWLVQVLGRVFNIQIITDIFK